MPAREEGEGEGPRMEQREKALEEHISLGVTGSTAPLWLRPEAVHYLWLL